MSKEQEKLNATYVGMIQEDGELLRELYLAALPKSLRVKEAAATKGSVLATLAHIGRYFEWMAHFRTALNNETLEGYPDGWVYLQAMTGVDFAVPAVGDFVWVKLGNTMGNVRVTKSAVTRCLLGTDQVMTIKWNVADAKEGDWVWLEHKEGGTVGAPVPAGTLLYATEGG